MKQLIVTISLALLLAGCAATRHHTLYEGDPAQKAEILSFETVIIKYIDEEDMGVSFIGQHQVYDIKAGPHVLVLEYSDLFDVNSDTHEKVVSRLAKISFNAEAGKQYQVQHPPQKQLADAQSFAKRPEFWVVELPSGERVASSMELSRPRGFLASLKPGSTLDEEFVSDSIETAAPADVAVPAANASAAAVVAKPNDSGELSNLKMLQYSWKNASEQERTEFLEWVKGK